MGVVIITNFQGKIAWEIVERLVTYKGKSAAGIILPDLIRVIMRFATIIFIFGFLSRTRRARKIEKIMRLLVYEDNHKCTFSVVDNDR